MADVTDERGTYTLLIELPRPAEIEIGALGVREFEPGFYAYAGSARGPGGFTRIDRHRRIAAGEHDVRHWHVDYLLGQADVELLDVVKSPGVGAECQVARAIGGDPIPGFGASDCDCDTHLFYRTDRRELERSIRTVHQRVGRSESKTGRAE